MSLLDGLLLDPFLVDIWVAANRTDSRGSGTINDPYAANTVAQFDSLMSSLAASDKTQKMRVHLGPGKFS